MFNLVVLLLAVLSALLLSLFIGASILVKAKGNFYILILSLLLLGYMTMGKGIAYLGHSPIYISEITLALGCGTVVFLALLTGRVHIRAVHHWSALVLLLFILWGAIRTFPYLSLYGMDALRDGVIWGYCLVAFCIALLLMPDQLERLLHAYSRLLPLILLGMVLGDIVRRFVPLPSLPDSPVPIITLKGGDAGVHLAGAGAFMLLRLDRQYGKRYSKPLIWLMWIFWGTAWILFGSSSRSGMVSALLGLTVAFLLRPKLSGWLRPAVLVSFMLFALLLFEVSGVYDSNQNVRRQISFGQISANFTSLVGGPSVGDQEGTMIWRLNWWKKIVGYTLGGPYLWTGKGFGINLTVSDNIGGRALAGTELNRHPHNITMNILARTGLPGLVLWLSFLILFGVRLLRATKRPGYEGRTAVWLLAYWLAFLFNAQTDVFLEGPMGGVWFWALVGFSWVFIYRLPKLNTQQLAIPAVPYGIDAMATSAPHT